MKCKRFGCLSFAILIIVIKVIWGICSLGNNGSFDTERKDILQRRNYLARRTLVKPKRLVRGMPMLIGDQFRGEWALYACSMFSAGLTNTSYLYPETKNDAIPMIDSLIQIVLSPEIREYDKARWQEDPLESLHGNKSHISYLSHVAWMISQYRYLGGGSKYDELFHSLCETMNRRILRSESLNLPTYPDEPIYVPDMLVAIVALTNYSKLHNGKYGDTVAKWVDRAKREWIDEETGLLASTLTTKGELRQGSLMRGSYSALNCYYLTFIDEELAEEQYGRLKDVFLQEFLITGFREYSTGFHFTLIDVDAGPILFRLSTTGTAFAVGSVTYFEDYALRKRLLKTAEIAGGTVRWGDRKHYMLADVALVGESIMFAMRTATDWDKR